MVNPVEVEACSEETQTQDRLVNEAIADGRKLATIREISSVNDIPGADLIKVAQVEGWQVVVKAGEFSPGDKCVFFEVDTFLPLNDSRFSFLEKNATTWHGIKGARLKTIRLRKQLSQGLALPLSLFPELTVYKDDVDVRDMNFTGLLHVMKWEKILSAQLAGMAKGTYPSFIHKSDQERAQNMGDEIFGTNSRIHGGLILGKTSIPNDVVERMGIESIELACSEGRMVLIDGEYFSVKGPVLEPARYEVTLKLDGSSMTPYGYAVDPTGFQPDIEPSTGICSRNLDLKIEGNEDNTFVKLFLELGLDRALMHENVGIQGELMGPGIQGNREGFNFYRFFVYNVFDIAARRFMTPDERNAFLDEFKEEQGIELDVVPVVAYGKTLAELGITNMAELLAFAVGPSINNPIREGLVFKALDGRHQFKVISNLFLERE